MLNPHKNITFFLLITTLLLSAGCSTTTKEVITRADAFPQIYSEKPHSIVVLPPINTSTFPQAGDYYMETIEEPLTLAGYKILPAETVTETIKQRSLNDTEALYRLPLESLHEYFGSDAVLYSRIKQWDIDKTGLLSRLIISIESEIVSTKTSERLWRYNSSLNVDLSAVSSTGGTILEFMKNQSKDSEEAVEEAIAYALKLNTKLTRDLPFGPEHEKYSQDLETEIIGTIPEKSVRTDSNPSDKK